jgi:four helix bundle protein
MNKLPYVQSYKELVVYQKARQLAKDLFHLSKGFPREETYSLTDQLRRSSRSIGAQIAEAWSKRRYEGHFVSKLTDADSEQYETQHWIEVAVDCGYLDQKKADELLNQCEELGRLLHGMRTKAYLFCGKNPNSLREPDSDYFTRSDEQ